MSTVLEALFPAKLPAQRRGPLVDAPTEIFSEHWIGALGVDIFVPAHTSLELVTQVCAKLQTNIFHAYVSSRHTTKLQAHVATLEERISNPTKNRPQAAPLANPQVARSKSRQTLPSQLFTTETNVGVLL